MKEIVLRYVDHYLTKSIKHKVIMACLLGGIGIINPGLWGAFLQSRLNIYLGINQNNSIYIGVGLIIFSLLLLIHDMYFTFLPTSFSTQKTSRCIYLGVNRYQFDFDRKMRKAPSIRITSPDNKHTIEDITNDRFVIKFETGKEIKLITFSADAWAGLNIRQRIYVFIINLFRSKNNKFSQHHYAEKTSNEKISLIDRQ